MNLGDTFNAPVVVKINDKDVSFPKLVMNDYATWATEIHTKRKGLSARLIPANAPLAEKVRMLRDFEFDEPTLDDIAQIVFTPSGAIEVLTRSLKKASVSEDDTKKIIESIPGQTVLSTAMEVSGLFAKKKPEPQEGQTFGQAGAPPLATPPNTFGATG